MSNRSVAPSARLSGSLFLAAPMLAALIYPVCLSALFNSGRVLLAGGGIRGAVLVAGSLLLVFAVPALGLYASIRLGAIEHPTVGQARARAFAHLAYACPPLFTLIGVLLYIAGLSGELVVWSAIWIPVLAFVFWSAGNGAPASSATRAPDRLRFLHGVSAATLLAIFLVWHISNHVLGFWSAELHQAAMKFLRTWYRSAAVEPILVALMVFQIGSGVVLLRGRLSQPSDLYASLQTAAGAYLAIFITSHLNAVFPLGRWEMGIDTDFFFASGGPAGLLADAWNVRLIPHYSLAVWSLFTHAACGLRSVLLAHSTNKATADRIAGSLSALGAVIAAIITAALCRVHIG
ncbi:MAG TPA: hypothetical protein VFB20_13415 [Burkholderiales bacterium]|nr:hypothetical protein [Burkholderiales bacterium]